MYRLTNKHTGEVFEVTRKEAAKKCNCTPMHVSNHVMFNDENNCNILIDLTFYIKKL